MSFEWDQSRFEGLVKEHLQRHESITWPNLMNKRMFFVAKRAIPETPKVEQATIVDDLAKIVFTRGQFSPFGESSSGPRPVELGYALAAKQASEGWSGSKRFGNLVKRNRAGGRGATPEMEAAAWEAEVKAKRGRITGARKAAAGFLRLGWLYVMKKLGPLTGLAYSPMAGQVGARMHGIDKGLVQPASEGHLTVVIQNIAHAQSETRGGFLRLGEPALKTALDQEGAELASHMAEEMEPHIQEFNRSQHR